LTTSAFVDGSTLSAASWANDVDTFVYSRLTSVSGTNTIVGTGPASMTAYATGQRFTFIPANTNTGAATLNITPSGGAALGAKAIQLKGAALVANEMLQNIPVEVYYDGTQFQLLATGAMAVINAAGSFTTLSASSVANIGIASSASTYLNLAASDTSLSSLRLAHGTAPSAPVNGDMWTTTAGLYVRINGGTVGPLS